MQEVVSEKLNLDELNNESAVVVSIKPNTGGSAQGLGNINSIIVINDIYISVKVSSLHSVCGF